MNRWELSDTDGQTERSNGAFGKSDIEGKAARVAARERGDANEFQMVGRDEVDGQPERARTRDAVESIILSRGLDAIRDSRIACKDGFRDTPWSRTASEVWSRCVSTKTASLARAE